MEATVSFWVVPWRLLFGLLIVGIFTGVGVWSMFRKSTRLVKRIKNKKT
jgi:hypothetical protein